MQPTIKINLDDILEVLRLNGAPPKEWLETLLANVDKDVVDAVADVLYDAKVEKILGEQEGRQIDFARALEERRKPALSGLKKFRRFMSARGAGALPWLDDNVRVLDKMKWPIPLRRPNEGRQRQPWINKARARLKRLRVSRNLSEDLLLACGIRHPRSKDDH